MPDYQELHDAIAGLAAAADAVHLNDAAPDPNEDELAEVCRQAQNVGALGAALEPDPEPEPEPEPEAEPEPEPAKSSRKGS